MGLVVFPDACLQFADAFEGEFTILIALDILLCELAHLEVDLSILLLIDL